MTTPNKHAEIANRFAIVASRFCSIVDSASTLDRSTFVLQVYKILPNLIHEAISLQDLQPSDDNETRKGNIRQRMEEWNHLYTSLKEKLGEWDRYMQVFDPTQETEAVHGSLADDLSDIYQDLKKGLDLKEAKPPQPENSIWEWRFGFYSHWGHHAMDALLTVHFRLQQDNSV